MDTIDQNRRDAEVLPVYPGATVLVRLTPAASHNKVGDVTLLLTGEEQLAVSVTAPPPMTEKQMRP